MTWICFALQDAHKGYDYNMKESCAVNESHKASLGVERPRARENIVSYPPQDIHARMYFIMHQSLSYWIHFVSHKIWLHFLPLHDTDMVQVVEIFPIGDMYLSSNTANAIAADAVVVLVLFA